MNESAETRELLMRALTEVRALRAELDQLRQERTAPLAIVGLGCRFPGGEDPAGFWSLLREGRDGVTAIPPERWDDRFYDPDPDAPGKANARRGGFLRDIWGFDPELFGISPREAVRMDPQQRCLLEVAWEALEDAGQPRDELAGSRTGVFMAIYHSEYLAAELAELKRVDAYTSTGNAHSIAANRLSYLLDLRGPSIVVDTACSSSLVSVHLACQSLRRRECDLALAGGVSLMLAPHLTVALAKWGMLSPEGRCKSFDARADGFVRGEGCGVVVLKRLSDALARGDRILAVIRGSAVNQDGRTAGLTAPSGAAQSAVLRQALDDARVRPSDVSYVEAHGAGTSLGDPIELEALKEVYGAPRESGGACLVGSVKSHVGHLEAAAGVAGLIKVVLALGHELIPGQLHFQQLNPHVSFAGSCLAIAERPQPWPRGNRFAAVSSFGFGGTNAHVILSEAPPVSAEPPGARQAELLTLSAHRPEALRELAQRTGDLMSSADAEPALRDLCYTAAARRTLHPYRLAVVGDSAPSMAEELRAFARGEPTGTLARGHAEAAVSHGIVFVFPGQGSQWLGMGRRLFTGEQVFREAIARCERAMAPYLERPLSALLMGEGASADVDRIDHLQPLLFALQVALGALWRSWGVEPEAVIGHSMGEIAALQLAGALSLEDAARVACLRSRLLRRIAGRGAMAVVDLTLEEARQALAGHEEHLSPAVSNSSSSTVLSGEPAALATVLDALRARDVFCRLVKVDVASHSPQVDPLCPELLEGLAGLTPQAPALQVYSTVTAEPMRAADAGASYWVRNLRQPVLFGAAVQRALRDGHRLFLEISPHPILLGAVQQALEEAGVAGKVLPTLRREEDERTTMLASAGALIVEGGPIDPRRVYRDGRVVSLPAYPWQRRPYRSNALAAWTSSAAGSGPTPASPPEVDESRSKPPSSAAEQLLYEVAWRVASREGGHSARPGPWWLFLDSTGVGEALARRLAGSGIPCVEIRPSGDYVRFGRASFGVRPTSRDDLRRLFAELSTTHADPARIVFLQGLDGPVAQKAPGPVIAEAAQGHLAALVNLVQSLSASGIRGERLLWVVTEADGLAASPLRGLAQVVAIELSDAWGGLVDMAANASAEDSAQALLEELRCPGRDDVVRLRGAERQVPRLLRASVARRGGWALRSDATYLLTGGLGFIGQHLARWMARRGARHLAFVGRSPVAQVRGEGQPARTIAELERMEVEVKVFQADVADAEGMQAVLSAIDQGSAPLRGVVHAAGVSVPQLVIETEPDTLAQVLRPKVMGGLVLHELTRARELDFLVFFSSAASVWGSRYLGAYAAANQFLDTLALHRRALGLPALSINWGRWEQIHVSRMQGSELEAFMTRIGLHPLPTDVALELLGDLLGSGKACCTVASVDWETFKPIYLARSARGLLDELDTSRRAEAEPPVLLGARFMAAPRDERRDALLALIRTEVSRLLGYDDGHRLDTRAGFFKLGMDSLMVVALKKKLERALGRTLPASVVFDHPTAVRLAEHLAGEEQRGAAPEQATEPGALRGLSEAEAERLLLEELARVDSLTRRK